MAAYAPATRRGCSPSAPPATWAPFDRMDDTWPRSARAVRGRSTTRRSRTWSHPAWASNRSARRGDRCTPARPTSLLAGTVATSYLPVFEPERHGMAASVVSGHGRADAEADPRAPTPNGSRAILRIHRPGVPEVAIRERWIRATEQAMDPRSAPWHRLPRPPAPGPPSRRRPPPAPPEWSRRHAVWGDLSMRGRRATSRQTRRRGQLQVTWGATEHARLKWQQLSAGRRTRKSYMADERYRRRNVVTQVKYASEASALLLIYNAPPDRRRRRGPQGASAAEDDTVVWGTSSTEGDTVRAGARAEAGSNPQDGVEGPMV